MADDKKIKIVLIIILVAAMGMLAYTLKDFFLLKNDKAAEMPLMPLGNFDESIIKNGMAQMASIGNIGSQYIHTDLKVYINGKALNFASPMYYMKSSFLHVDNNQNLEDASSVLHMHATNVPMWVFFKSIGIDLSKECIILDNGQKLCTGSKNALKFYVNSKPLDDLGDYVFNDNDKIMTMTRFL